MNTLKILTKWLNKEIHLLDEKRDRYLLIAIILLFSIVFLNVFVPFNINRWFSDSGFIQFIRLSGYGVIVAIALLFTQFPLRKIFRIKTFQIKSFILWLGIEISLISLIYIFLYGNPLGNFMNELTFSLKYTLLGIFFPYSLSLLLIHYRNQYVELRSLKIKVTQPGTRASIGFKDEKGKIRFSVLLKDLLFLESADNYVYVYYLSAGKPQRKILRNSLRNLENKLKPHSVVRCHRSFIVNKENVEMIQKERKKLFLSLRGTDRLIPVSTKYSGEFIHIFHEAV